MKEELKALIAAATTQFEAMTPEEKATMLRAQAESWVRGEMAMGEDVGRSTAVNEAAELEALRAQVAALTAERDAAKLEAVTGALAIVRKAQWECGAIDLTGSEVEAEIIGPLEALCASRILAALEPAPVRDEANIRWWNGEATAAEIAHLAKVSKSALDHQARAALDAKP